MPRFVDSDEDFAPIDGRKNLEACGATLDYLPNSIDVVSSTCEAMGEIILTDSIVGPFHQAECRSDRSNEPFPTTHA